MKRYHLPYESQTYSQHGEDGIIAVMTEAILDPNRFVFEIGWGSGKQNMSRCLMEQGWRGIGIDGAHEAHPGLHIPSTFQYRQLYVDPTRFDEAFSGVPKDMDFFSLDIDSFDYEVARWALDNGFRPKTVCLEFNQRFGPEVQASFPWAAPAPGRKKIVYNKHLFHGVSLAKYRALWQAHGYQYFGFDSSGVNVFFYDPGTVGDLSALPRLHDHMLAVQTDLVRDKVLQDDYWRDRVTDIYQEA
jgi:hypothetical protein